MGEQSARTSPTELQERIARGEPIELIDVRTPAEFREGHVAGARCVPLHALKPNRFETESEVPLFLICKSGSRSQQASSKLTPCSREICIVEGGVDAWFEAGLPLVHEEDGRHVISLERQVRIAAGALTLAGALLGFFVHPGFLWLSAFVGAGLIFAGVTDTCGMALLLARMPWNQN